MPSPRRPYWTVSIALALLASAAQSAVRPNAEASAAISLPERAMRPAVQQALARGASWRTFQARYGAWNATFNEATGTPHRAFGRAIPLRGFRDDAASTDQALRAFFAKNPEIFGDAQLELADAHRAGGIWYVRYRQMVAGIPVLDADWEFRVGSNGNLMAFGADRHSVPTRIATAPRVGLAVAREAAKAGIAFDPATDRVEGDRMWVLPIAKGSSTDYRVVYELHVWTRTPHDHWYTLVDAATGQVLERRSRVVHAITGTVTATVHPNLTSDPLSIRPLANLLVTTNGPGTPPVAYTDSLGNYSLDASGTVTLTAGLRGRFVNIDRCQNQGGTDVCPLGDASFSTTASNPSSGKNIAWAGTNSQTSERDAYYHVNIAHDWIKAIDPTLTSIDYEIPTYVDLMDNCNAEWDGVALSFFSAGSGCPNTATIPDIVYHEYNHAANDNLYIAHGRPGGLLNAALGEGLADVMASYIPNDSLVGNGFFGGGTYLRNVESTRSWPQDRNTVSPQEGGLILASAMWDLKQAVGINIAKRIMQLAKNGLPDDPDDGVAFNEYFVEVLVADDNDNNLSNGTPHFAQIAAAFNAHGIGTNYFVNIAVTADDQSNVGPFPITAMISYNGGVGSLNTSSPTLFYSINNAPFTSVTMFPTGNPDEYGASVPARVSAVVRYYVRAATSDGGIQTWPPGAPTRYATFIGGPFSVMNENDFDNDQGWTVGASGDAATAGVWTRVDPNGTAIQPEDDHSVSGTMCYVTGNAAAGQPIAIADVDGGKTSLVSAAFDATAGGLIRPVVSYWRWYSNNGGDNPGQDAWKVEISNNGGSSWTTVENTLETDMTWRRVMFFISDFVTPTNNMKLRFVATDDTSFPSLVEAAVDDFALYGYPPTVDVAGDPGAFELKLARPSPNPFRSVTSLAYTLPRAGAVDLAVFDLQGRHIRSLVQSSQQAGPHSAQWDGRDASGRPVANGPYFVRLSHDGRATSEAVVLLK